MVGAKTPLFGNEPTALRPERRETNLVYATELNPRHVVPVSGFLTAGLPKTNKSSTQLPTKKVCRFAFILIRPCLFWNFVLWSWETFTFFFSENKSVNTTGSCRFALQFHYSILRIELLSNKHSVRIHFEALFPTLQEWFSHLTANRVHIRSNFYLKIACLERHATFAV